MTTVAERLEQILDGVAVLPAQTWPVADLAASADGVENFVLAQTVHSPVDLPNRTVARINGYAGKASELQDADPQTPLLIEVSGDLTAPDRIAPAHRAGQVWRVATGAPIPEGADTIVPLAHTDRHHRKVQIRRPGVEGAHIWRAGDDIRAGDVLVEAGDALAPGVVAALIAAQITSVSVFSPIRVGVVATLEEAGETAEAEDAAEAAETFAENEGLDRGEEVQLSEFARTPDANGPMIAGAVRIAGHRVARTVQVPSSGVGGAIRSLKGECDLIVVIAAVGGGPDDIVEDELPSKIAFVDVDALPSIAPGFGTVGFGKTPVIALPGDPVSARIAFELFVHPAMDRRSGHGTYQPHQVTALVRRGWSSGADLQEYVPIRLSLDVSGSYLAAPREGIAGLVGADGLALVEAGSDDVRVGDEISVRLLRPVAEVRRRLLESRDSSD